MSTLSPQLYIAKLRINEQKINEISYVVDDIELIVESVRQLQKMLDKLNKARMEYGMKINITKTSVMRFSRNENANVRVSIGNEAIKGVTEFGYLGTLISTNEEIKGR